MALLRSLVSLAAGSRTVVVAAHFNHGWRGPQSDEDQKFVERLCRQLSLQCELGAASKTGTPDTRTETAARETRHQFLCEVGTAVGARYVATGHTADDQVETVLHRILRGTGLAGLGGIPRTRPLNAGLTLMRPLLTMRRSEVLTYLRELGQNFCEDATNQERKYTRNRIRHELIPSLASDYNPNVAEAILRLAALAGEAQGLLDPMAEKLYDRSLEGRDLQGVTLQLAVLQAAPCYLVREMLIAIWKDFAWPLRQMSNEKWDQLAALALGGQAAHGQRLTLPGRIRAERASPQLRIWRE